MSRYETEEDKTDKTAEQATDQLGKALGMEMSPALRGAVKVAIGLALPKIRPKFEAGANIVTDFVLGKVLKKPELYSKVAPHIALATGLVVAASPQLIGFWGTLKDYWSTLKETGKKVDLVSKEGQANNFILEEEKSSAFQSVKLSFKQNLGNLISAAPQIYLAVQDSALNKAYAPIGAEVEKIYAANADTLKQHYYDSQYEIKKRIEQNIRANQEFPEIFRKVDGLRKKKEEVGTFIENYGATLIGPLADEFVQGQISKRHKDESRQSIYSMIEELSAKIKNEPGANSYHLWGAHRNLADAVAHLIAETYKRKYKTNTHLSDQKLEEVSTQIAEALKSDGLNPMELVALIGQSQIVKNKSGEMASAEEVEKVIDAAIARTSKEKPADAKEQLKNLEITEEDISKAFEMAKGNKEHLAFLAAITPASITMKETGLKRNQVRALVRKTHNKVMADIEDAFLELAAKSPEELKKLGFSKKQQNEMQSLAISAEENGREVISAAVGNEQDPGIEKFVLKAMAKGAKLGSWTERVSESNDLRNLSKAVEEEDSKSRTSKRGIKPKSRTSREESDTVGQER